MLKVKVRNMTSHGTGREIPNQFLIYTDEGVYFQSYSTVIAFKANTGKVYLHDGSGTIYSWDCTTTTGKYRNDFLGEGVQETRKKLKDGIYTLANLN